MSRQQKSQEFQSITGCNASKAELFLEHAAWNLDVAMSRFFDDPDNPSGQQHVIPDNRGGRGNQGGYGGGNQGYGGYGNQGGYGGNQGYGGGYGNQGAYGGYNQGYGGGYGGYGGGQQRGNQRGNQGGYNQGYGGYGMGQIGAYGAYAGMMQGSRDDSPPPRDDKPKPSGLNKASTLIAETVVDGVKIQVRHGDMTEEDVGAIVNAANKHLDHGSGLAGAIRKKGGEMVQIESDIYISENGPLGEGHVVALGGHELKCEHVIHANGPIWNGGAQGEPVVLQMCVRNCLDTANTKLKIKSISLPAISTGIFRFPKPTCAVIMFDVILDWIKDHPVNNRTLQEIRLTNFDDETVQIFKTEFFKRFGGADGSVELEEEKDKKPTTTEAPKVVDPPKSPEQAQTVDPPKPPEPGQAQAVDPPKSPEGELKVPPTQVAEPTKPEEIQTSTQPVENP